MKEKVRFLGLDVHAETIAVAVAEPDGEVRSLGTIPNRGDSIRKMIKKLGPAEKLRACYEAGPTGYVVYWQLAELGIQCEVVAPTLVALITAAPRPAKADTVSTAVTATANAIVISLKIEFRDDPGPGKVPDPPPPPRAG
jgi:hypothetical protein